MELADLLDPVAYGPWWGIAGAVAVLAALGWVVFAWKWGRPWRAAAEAPAEDPLEGGTSMDPFAGARRRRLERLDEIEHRHRSGEIGDRETTLEVAAVLRDFATVRRGVNADPLTSAELRALGWTGGAGELISSLLEPEFSAPGATTQTAVVAVARAREVISRW